MAEYLIQEESLTAIADEIRTLSGVNSSMGLSAMTTNTNNANTEINRQSDLLAQITTALQDKATGNASIPTCTVELKYISNYYRPYGGYTTIDANGKLCPAEISYNGVFQDVDGDNRIVTLNNVVCGSALTSYDGITDTYSLAVSVSDGVVVHSDEQSTPLSVFGINVPAGSTAFIEFTF